MDELIQAIQETNLIKDQLVCSQIKRRQKVVIEARIDSSLKHCFENLSQGDVPYLNVLKETISLIFKASDWHVRNMA